MKIIAVAALTVALAAPAVAADTQDAPKSKPHLICKRDEGTGTRMQKRVCKTAAEWGNAGADADEGQLDAINREATTRDIGATLSRDRPR